MAETRIETYIPLYRKYRPQTFADLVGQEAISQTLGNAINLNKVAHAYLFCGPRGTGKTSAARIFAKSLNCEQGPTMTPCLQCASCTGIAHGNALDVVEFDAASNNGVGDARELIENCQYTSMTGRFKVYIIDEVHMLTSQAFNALLKTLEEPPPNVIFIFATTEAHKVLPTIISRCQRFDFNRITTENIVSRLRYIAGQESIAIDDEALLMIARHSRGGLRDAVGLLDQVAVLGRAQADKIIGRKDVALFIGTLEEDLLLRLSRAIAERRAADLLHELNELLNRGIEPIQLLKDLTSHFRNLLLVQAAGNGADPELLALPPDYYSQLREQTALFPQPEELPQIIGRLSFVERNIRNGTQPQLWLEVGLIELAYRYDIQVVKDLSDRVAQLEAQLAGGAPLPAPATRPAAAAPQPMPARPAAMHGPTHEPTPSMAQPMAVNPAVGPAAASSFPEPAPMTVQQAAVPMNPLPQPGLGGNALEGTFSQITQAVASLTARSLLQQQFFPISLDGDVLVLGCASETNLTSIKNPNRFIHLQKAADKILGRTVRIELIHQKKPEGRPEPPMAQAAPVTAAAHVASPVPAMSVAAPVASSASPVSAIPPTESETEPPQAAIPAMPSIAESRSPAIPPVQVPELSMAPVAVLSPEAPPADEPLFAPPPMGPDDGFSMSDDAPPPMEDDFPDDEEEDDELPAPMDAVSAGVPQAAVAVAGLSSDNPDLADAKKHAVELLQGRILD
ncbi:MAG TPA: DNA polymerase III subunit gamma/tau [Coleofasciculaceae cyanobacterium]|jgi:DNA polymerase-3 subunit gamma/tau